MKRRLKMHDPVIADLNRHLDECGQTAAYEEYKAARFDELQEEFYRTTSLEEVVVDDESSWAALNGVWRVICQVKDSSSPNCYDTLAATAMRSIMRTAAKTYALKTFEKEVLNRQY
jgi:hypothetical protein